MVLIVDLSNAVSQCSCDASLAAAAVHDLPHSALEILQVNSRRQH